MDSYNCYQQYKDYFALAGVTGANTIFFAASFFQDRISFYWQQYKQRYDQDSFVSFTWNKFKTFLRRSLGNLPIFADTYWEKIKRDFQYQLKKVLE